MIEEIKKDIQCVFDKVLEKSNKQKVPDILVYSSKIKKTNKKLLKKPSKWNIGEHISFQKSRKLIKIKEIDDVQKILGLPEDKAFVNQIC